MADILTHGRVVFGVGRGYHTREVETFGAPMLNADANRALFEEQVEIILQAFNEDSVQQRNWLCGTPDDVISLLHEVEEKYPGLRRVIVSSPWARQRPCIWSN